MQVRDNRPSRKRRRVALSLAAALACAVAITPGGGAAAQDLQSQLDSKRSELDQKKAQQGVLTTQISHYSDRIDQLSGEVATLRNREAIVQAELDRVEARLRREKNRLEVLRDRLGRSLGVLRNRLVAIYKSDEPDALTVILNSDGFDDLLDRYEYLRRIEEQDASIVNRVRDLRDETEDTVTRIKDARDEITARKAELVRTRTELEAREGELDAVRDRKQGALDDVEANVERLEGDIGDLEGQIQAQLQAAQSTTTPTLPAGPIQGESATGFIWPVNGPVVSPFGMRWGRLHAGIDIAVPSGTPIRAAKSGTVALAAPYGGYGNYTCIDHGGGVSSCYAHQSSFAVGTGESVSQGQVIGYSDCTGSCLGPHLHFEIRINGTPVDPLGYL
jgi:murein DD-endopeptidase MepM/ murein hydrolase activator NlpD